MRWSVVLAVAVLVPFSACGASPPRSTSVPEQAAPPPAPPPAPAELPDGEPVVIDPGAEPRYELRYRPAVGTHREVTMDFRMGMTFDGTRTIVPTTSFPATWDIIDVASDGTLTARLTFGKPVVVATPDTTPEQVAAMQASVDTLANLTNTSRSDARGREIENLLDPRTPPDVRKMVEDTSTALAQLPIEAVGRGARWTVRTRKVNAEATYDMVTTIVLLGIDGDAVRLHLDQSLAITMNEYPEITGTGEGHGESLLDLRALTVDATVAIATHVTTPAGEVSADMNMRFRAR